MQSSGALASELKRHTRHISVINLNRLLIHKGVSLVKFYKIHSKWIDQCRTRYLLSSSKTANPTSSQQPPTNKGIMSEGISLTSWLVRLCFGLSLVCRRALHTACTGSAGSGSSGIELSALAASFVNHRASQVVSQAPTTSQAAAANNQGSSLNDNK